VGAPTGEGWGHGPLDRLNPALAFSGPALTSVVLFWSFIFRSYIFCQAKISKQFSSHQREQLHWQFWHHKIRPRLRLPRRQDRKRDLDWERKHHIPATSCPLNLTSTSCGIAVRGMNIAWKRRLPADWTVHGTEPPFTAISRSPWPARIASTAHDEKRKLVRFFQLTFSFGYKIGDMDIGWNIEYNVIFYW